MNQELKLLGNCEKRRWRGVRSGGGGVMVDVNQEFKLL